MPKKEGKKALTAIVDEELKKKLEQQAKKNRRSLSQYTAIVLEDHIRSQEGEKKP